MAGVKKVVKKEPPVVTPVVKPVVVREWVPLHFEKTVHKINWIGIRRKIIEVGKVLKGHNMQLPEIKFIYTIWNEYCKWWNEVVNHVKE